MSQTSAVRPSRSRQLTIVVQALVLLEGAITIFAAYFMFPLGVALVIMNAILAFAVRGSNRKWFAIFAIVGSLVCFAFLLTSVAVGGVVQVETPVKL